METILHLLPLTPDQQAAFRSAAPEAEHLFLPTHDRRGATDIPPDWRQRITILMGFVPPSDLKTFPNLKWVQSWNAGVDPYMVPGVLPEGVVLTCAAGAYGPAVSEHMLAILLAIYKRLPDYGTPAKGQQKTDFAHQRGRACGFPQALLFVYVRKGCKKPVDCPRPRYLRSAAKNDLSIWVKPQPCMVKMRACGVPHALIFTYASQKRLPKI